MRSFFKLIWIFVLIGKICSAGTHVVISFDKQEKLAKLAQEQFIKEHNIPKSMVKTVKQNQACELNLLSIVQLCIANNGEIHYIKKESEAIRFAFKSFLE